MAALNRPVEATYETHETVRVDTSDNEDHTFSGIMFPIRAKAILPVDKIVLHSLSIRGQLGLISVWVTNEDEQPDENGEYRIRLTARHWTKVYEKTHAPSQKKYQKLDLTPGGASEQSWSGATTADCAAQAPPPGEGVAMAVSEVTRDGSAADNNTTTYSKMLHKPIILRPGQIRGIYIHSTLDGDEAIVYDNADPRKHPKTPRYEDDMIAIHQGKAHLSSTPFGQMPLWGWGNAWRDRREFVGQIEYGATYQLWNPEVHYNFGPSFRAACRTMLALQRQEASPVSGLPDECIFYILNMCRWDWFRDSAKRMKRGQRERKARQRLLEQQQRQLEHQHQQQQQMVVGEDPDVMAVGAEGAAGNNADGNDGGTGDEDGNESDESAWERANGYRADTNFFSYGYMSSDDEAESEEQQRRVPFYRSMLQRAWVLHRLGRGRVEHGHHHDEEDDDDDDSDT